MFVFFYDIILYMNQKGIIMLFLVVGSILGGLMPSLWGEGSFSISSIIFTALGGLAGIFLGYKISS